MADGTVQLPVPDSDGALVDTSTLTVDGQSVNRQRVVIGDPTAAEQLAAVTSAGAVKVDGSAVTQPVSASSLPLPSGAAQDSTVAGVTTSLGSDGSGESPANGTGVRGWLRSIYDRLTAGLGRTWTLSSSSDSVDVGNWPSTQPVSGTVSLSGTSAVSGTVTAGQGTAAALSGAWPVEVTDGTNVLGTSSHPLRVDPTGTTTQPVSLASLPALVAGTATIGAVGTPLASAPTVGQTTLGESATQLSGTSHAATNGIAVQALSGNSESVFIGGSGVTTSNGWELQPGQGKSFAVANITELYGVSENGTDGVCWSVD